MQLINKKSLYYSIAIVVLILIGIYEPPIKVHAQDTTRAMPISIISVNDTVHTEVSKSIMLINKLSTKIEEGRESSIEIAKQADSISKLDTKKDALVTTLIKKKSIPISVHDTVTVEKKQKGLIRKIFN